MFKLRVSLFPLCFLVVGGLLLASGAALAGHGGGGHGGGGHGGGAHFGGAHFGGVGVGHVGGVSVGRFGGVGVGGVGVGRFGGVGGVGVARFGALNPGLTAINRNFIFAPRVYGFRFPYGLGYGLGFGLGYGLGYGGYGYGYGGYGGYGYYGGGYPYGYGNNYAYGSGLYNTYTSYYAPESQTQQQPPQPDDAAHILVVVPSDAELWFNGSKTSQTGTQRDFVSPALTLGKNYTYEVKARWMEDGKRVEQTRTVHVQANSWQVVDFTRSEKEKSPKTPAPMK